MLPTPFKGVLDVGALTAPRIAGTFFATNNSVRLTFSDGRYRPSLGRLTLSGGMGGSNPLVLRLSAISRGNRCELAGTGFRLANGVFYDVRLSGIAP